MNKRWWLHYPLIISGILLVVYTSSYLVLKWECYSRVMIPADPWIGSGERMVGKVSYWGKSVLGGGRSLRFRDPGHQLSDKEIKFLNGLFAPMRPIDARLTGWAVKYRSPEFRRRF